MVVQLTDTQAWAIGMACAAMCLDCVTGFLQAVINNTVSSAKMREGLGHKAALLCAIVLALGIEVGGQHIMGLGFSGVTVVLVSVYVIVMEVASICENLCLANPELRDSPLMHVFDHGDDEG